MPVFQTEGLRLECEFRGPSDHANGGVGRFRLEIGGRLAYTPCDQHELGELLTLLVPVLRLAPHRAAPEDLWHLGALPLSRLLFDGLLGHDEWAEERAEEEGWGRYRVDADTLAFRDHSVFCLQSGTEERLIVLERRTMGAWHCAMPKGSFDGMLARALRYLAASFGESRLVEELDRHYGHWPN